MGTPSEPIKDELQDDLAEEGSKAAAPEAVDEPSSDEVKEPNEPGEPSARPKKARKKKVTPPPERPQGKPLARGLAMLVLIGVPVALLLFSGRERGGGGKAAGGLPNSTRWAVGSEQNIDITLVAQDRTNLVCASTEEVAGKHCEHEARDKRWSKGPTDDKVALKPYRLAGTNDPVLISGLWSEPTFKAGLPGERFTAKCKLKVEGKMKKPVVRWNPGETWYDEPFDWPTGTVSNCTITK